MELPFTQDLTQARHAALRAAILKGAEGLDYEDAYYFTLGCRLGLNERAAGIKISDATLSVWPEIMRSGRELTFNFS